MRVAKLEMELKVAGQTVEEYVHDGEVRLARAPRQCTEQPLARAHSLALALNILRSSTPCAIKYATDKSKDKSEGRDKWDAWGGPELKRQALRTPAQAPAPAVHIGKTAISYLREQMAAEFLRTSLGLGKRALAVLGAAGSVRNGRPKWSRFRLF